MAILHKHPHHHHARPAPKPLAILKAGCTIRMYVRILDGGVALDWTDDSLSYKDVRIWSDPRKGYIGRPTCEVCEKDPTVLVAQYDTDAADLPGVYRLTVDATYNGWQMVHTIPVYWLEGNVYCKCGAEYVEGCDTPMEHDVTLDLKGVSTTYLQSLIDEMIALRQDENERITTLELLMAKAMERLSCHAKKIAALEERMDSAESRLDADESELADHEERITSAEETLKDYGERIETLEKDDEDHEERIGSLESRVTSIETKVTEQGTLITNLQEIVNTINQRVTEIQSGLSDMEGCCKEVQSRLDDLESRVSDLENGEEKEPETEYYTLTINPTPSDAKVVIDGEERTSITVESGTEVSYEVSADGYITKSGTWPVTEDYTLDVVLEEEEVEPEPEPEPEPDTVTFTITVTPSDATVTINNEVVGADEEGNHTVTVEKGSTVEWSCDADGYMSQSGSQTVDEDTVLDVTLRQPVTLPDVVTVTVNTDPEEATVTMTITDADFNTSRGTGKTAIVTSGSTVMISVSCDGYDSKRVELGAVTESTTVDVTLTESSSNHTGSTNVTVNMTPTDHSATLYLYSDEAMTDEYESYEVSNGSAIVVPDGTWYWKAVIEHSGIDDSAYTITGTLTVSGTATVTLDFSGLV